ncbi:hypothetical protein G6F32_016043 [Rhizopus arrhizus]|nr:hypothetical protein G6F32_016043 [Rhizopus arrhizus]
MTAQQQSGALAFGTRDIAHHLVQMRGIDQRARSRRIDVEILWQAGRRFHQRVLRFAVAHQMREATHGLGLGRIGRHPRRVERGGSLVVVAQPHREHRLVAVMARAQAERAGQRLRCIGGRGERGRSASMAEA